MPDGIDRNIAVGIVFAVEEVAGRDRILDQRRVGSVPAAGVHQKTRLREVRSEQVPFSRRIFLGRLDVNTVEIVHPKLRIAVDRHIALVLAFEQHQTLDEPRPSGVGCRVTYSVAGPVVVPLGKVKVNTGLGLR